MADPATTTLATFAALLAVGVPIGTSLGVASIAAISVYDYGINVVSPNFYANIAKFPLLAIPFFITAGVAMQEAGVADRIIRLAKVLVGDMTGGLALVAILTATFWGAVSGSGPATTAAIGVILIPALIASGYSRGFSGAVISTSSGLAIIIPPSIALIIYGVIMQVSIGKLFIAGIIPGLILSSFLLLTAMLIAKKRGYRGEVAQRSLRDVWVAFREAFWGLLSPVIILGGIYAGVFTPTEAAVVSVVYSMFLGFVVYRTLSFRRFFKILVDSAELTAVVMFVVAFAGLFSWVEQTAGLIDKFVGALMGITTNETLIMLIIMVILLIAGMFLDAISIYYVFLPIIIPIMINYGWDPIWFGIVMTVNLAIGQVTPPVAVNAYVAAKISRTTLEDIARESLPFIIAAILALLLMVVFPELVTWLPSLAG